MTIKCKYCRALTEHRIIGTTEKHYSKCLIIKCRICNFTKLLYRKQNKPEEPIIIDDSMTPERTVIMPYDQEFISERAESEVEENIHKEIDKWLSKKN